MIERVVSAFKDPRRHIASSEIIRRFSTNKKDIREVALDNLDLKNVHKMLDLGCGFGFISKLAASRLHSDALIIGVDALQENGPYFLKAIGESGRNAEFVHYQITDSLPWRENSFDFIIASYSLYFFAEIIPEIRRVLHPGGIFLTITHCHDSFSGLYKAARLNDEDTPIAKLINNFSCENGRQKLAGFFGKIDTTEYNNSLIFEKENLKDLIDYAKFKMPLMVLEADNSGKIIDNISRTLFTEGKININKNDVVFRCREPQ